jgi:hypothetical protein
MLQVILSFGPAKTNQRVKNAIIQFYKTCIRPVLEYASIVFRQSLPKYLRDNTDTDTDISQHTPYQGFSVTGYIMNR